MRFNPVLRKALIIFILAMLCVGVVSYKVYLFNKLPFLDPKDGEAFFWTESAFHFRHFQMVAEGKDIPSIDYGIQYPEGLDTVRYITPVMERVTGPLYRIFFSNTPSHLFLTYFSFIFSTLSVLAIFLAGKIAWRSSLAGFFCSLFYGFTPASIIRTAGGGFLREDFALPFVFFSFACFIYCLRKDRPLVSAIGSLLLVIALASWHATQLYLSLFMVGMATIYFLNKGKGVPQKSMLVFVAFMVTAALILPPLRAKYFIFSPALMLSYGLLATAWIPALKDGYKWKNIKVGSILIIGAFVVSFLIQKITGSYSHVYALIFYKIRFLGVLPEDPARLSFEAKSMWTSSFMSPKWIELPFMLWFSLLLGPLGSAIMIYRIIKRKSEHHETMIVYFTVCTFVLFLMIHRMSVFAVFFLVLSMGALTLVNNRYLKYATYGFLGLCFMIQVYVLLNSLSLKAFRPNQKHLKDMITFIKTKTPRNAPVLTTFQLGPAVAAYARHPVILHSKFESKLLRDKVEQVYTSLFHGEDEFYELCKRYKVGLFVYQSDMALHGEPMSIRYLAGAIPLRTDSAAFLFHFAPNDLKHFRLIYQNPTYRVFKVGTDTPHEQVQLPYQPIYDLSIFLNGADRGEYIVDGILKSGKARLGSSETHLKLGNRFFNSGDYRTSVLEYERALMINKQNKKAAWGLGVALMNAGEEARARGVLRAALRLDPDYDVTVLDIRNADILVAMGDDELRRKRYDRAARIFKEAIDVKPDTEEAFFGLGEALFEQEKFEQAKRAYQKVLFYDPDHYQAHESLGKIYAAQGDIANAAVHVQKSLSINPLQPRLRRILDILIKQMGKSSKL